MNFLQVTHGSSITQMRNYSLTHILEETLCRDLYFLSSLYPSFLHCKRAALELLLWKIKCKQMGFVSQPECALGTAVMPAGREFKLQMGSLESELVFANSSQNSQYFKNKFYISKNKFNAVKRFWNNYIWLSQNSLLMKNYQKLNHMVLIKHPQPLSVRRFPLQTSQTLGGGEPLFQPNEKSNFLIDIPLQGPDDSTLGDQRFVQLPSLWYLGVGGK